MVRATVRAYLPVKTNGRRVIQEAEVLRGEWPETLRESSAYERGTSTFKYVEVGSLNDRVVLRNASPRSLLQDAKSGAGELQFRGIVRVHSANLMIPEEVH